MKSFFSASILLLLSSSLQAKVFDPPLTLIIKAEVADVRSDPTPHGDRYEYDPLQETQVEKGEPVLVYEKKGGWARIEAPDQMEYTHNDRWQGYPGWIQWSALVNDLQQIHELMRPKIAEAELRKKILEKASLHLGAPYLWGGRSLYKPQLKFPLTGVDCSGLVNWSFRQMGIAVPRDAHEQYMRARPVPPAALKPADLIFLAKKENPQKIVHVSFFVKDEEILEAPQSGEKVRKISFVDRFGKSRLKIKQGETLGDRVIYFGTLFTEGL